MKDLRGIEIKVGDEVLYFKTGRYPDIISGRVTELKKKVKVGELKSLSRPYSDGRLDALWVENTSLIVSGNLPQKAEDKPVPAAVTLPATPRVELEVLYPARDGESASEHTTRLLSHAREHGTNRQCSIGWHGECSERNLGEDADCNCLCHGDLVEIYSVEGDAEDGAVTVIRAERGEHMWPPKEGEPETMWAWWVLARSEAEAAVQGASKERNRLA